MAPADQAASRDVALSAAGRLLDADAEALGDGLDRDGPLRVLKEAPAPVPLLGVGASPAAVTAVGGATGGELCGADPTTPSGWRRLATGGLGHGHERRLSSLAEPE